VTEKLLLEIVEDAFLSALEEGAKPPREFTVRLPTEVVPRNPGPTLRVAGYVVNLICGSPEDYPEGSGHQ
jgi:hypothetical protein